MKMEGEENGEGGEGGGGGMNPYIYKIVMESNSKNKWGNKPWCLEKGEQTVPGRRAQAQRWMLSCSLEAKRQEETVMGNGAHYIYSPLSM